MAFTESLRLLIDADTRGAIQGVEKFGAAAERETSRAEKSLDRWGSRLTAVGTGMIAFGAAAVAGLGALAMESEQARLSQLKLENTLQNMPKLAGESSDQFVDLAESIQKVTAADADAIVEAEALLGTFSLTADEIKGITPLVVDYARKFGIDMADAAVQVGKALDGQVGALKRNGVSIDEALFATDRYRAVQEALSDQVGGFAEAEGKTFAGSLERMKNELGDLAEGVGTGAVDAFETMFGAVGKVAGALEGISPGAQNLIGQVSTFGAVALIGAGGLNLVAGQAILARQNIAGLATAIKGVSFANLATGLAVLAPLTAGAGIALSAYTRTKEEAKRVTDGYVEALKKEADGTRGATDAYSAAELTAGKLGSKLRDAGADLEVFNEAIKSSGDEIENLDDNLDVIRELGLDKALESGAVASSALTDELMRLNGEMSRGEMVELINRLDGLSDRYDDATEASANTKFAEDELATQHGETAAATEGVATATEEATTALQAYNDQLHAQADPLFAAIHSQDQLAQANNDVTGKTMELVAAQQEHGASSLEAMAAAEELRQAQIDAGEAALDHRSSLIDLLDAMVNQGLSADDAKRKLYDMMIQSGVSAEAADALMRSIDGVTDAAYSIPENRTVAVGSSGIPQTTLDLINLRAKAEAVPREINIITRLSTILTGSTNIPRQHGGPVEANRAYIVGETQPELFVPNRSGTIVPSVGRMSAGGGTTVVYNLTFQGPTNDQQVVEAIKRFERNNGSGWRN